MIMTLASGQLEMLIKVPMKQQPSCKHHSILRLFLCHCLPTDFFFVLLGVMWCGMLFAFLFCFFLSLVLATISLFRQKTILEDVDLVQLLQCMNNVSKKSTNKHKQVKEIPWNAEFHSKRPIQQHNTTLRTPKRLQYQWQSYCVVTLDAILPQRKKKKKDLYIEFMMSD
jgi:hypothetical protein